MAGFMDDEEDQDPMLPVANKSGGAPAVAPAMPPGAGVPPSAIMTASPEDIAYQKEVRRRLLDQMNMYDRNMAANAKLDPEARSDQQSLSRRLALNEALAKGAAQIGTIAGQQADTSAVSGITSRLLDSQKMGGEMDQKQKESREKLQQYLMGKMLEQEGTLGKAIAGREELGAKNLEKQNELTFKEKENDKDRKARQALADAAAQAKADAANTEGKQVPGTVAADLGAFDGALAQVDALKKSYDAKASGFGSGAKSEIKGTQPNEYQRERDVAAQEIGRVLEGGKLTDMDYERYKNMLPSPWDTNEVAEAKIAAMKNAIQSQREGRLSGLRQTGFNVTKVNPVPIEGLKPPKGSSSGSATAAPLPKKVTQNGHTYIYNEKTKEYE